MWAAATDVGGLDAAIITAVWAFLGIVVTTLGTIAVQALRSRRETTTTSQPQPVDGNGTALIQIAKEQGALVQRADDNDDRDDMQDRRHERTDDRLEALERYHDHRDPNWRRK